jgi:hypothetical protein
LLAILSRAKSFVGVICSSIFGDIGIFINAGKVLDYLRD